MSGFHLMERRFEAFLRKPLAVRTAMGVIVTATAASVIIGGVAMALIDPKDFSNVGIGMWWALQTVTTVGYGDVTPTSPVGRAVGAVFMLESIAFIAIVTAAITSSFVERARREAAKLSGGGTAEELVARLAEISARLEAIEAALAAGRSDGERRD